MYSGHGVVRHGGRLGLVAGPAFAGILSRPGVDIGRGSLRFDGYSIPFLFSAALTVVVLAFARRHLKEPPAPALRRPEQVLGAGLAGRAPGLGSLLGLVTASQYGLAGVLGRVASPLAQVAIGFGLMGSGMLPSSRQAPSRSCWR